MRIATENLIADFLHEIRDVAYVAQHLDERESLRRQQEESLSRSDTIDLRGPLTADSYDGTAIDASDSPSEADGDSDDEESKSPVRDEKGTGGIVFLYFDQSYY